MSEGKMIRGLIAFELKNTPLYKYLLLLLAIGFSVYLFNDLLVSMTFENRLSISYDFILMFLLTVPLLVFRYKPFTISEMKGGLYASSFFILLKQTPIPDKVLMKSRFITTGLYTFVTNTWLVIMFYLLSVEFRLAFSFSELIILWVIIVLLGYIWGGMLAASDPGQIYSTTYLVIFCIVFYGGIAAFLTGVNLITGGPIVYWIVYLVKTNPLLAIFIAALTCLLSTLLWIFEYKRYSKSVDYHL